MSSYQDIELRITEVADKTAQMAFMNKEQLFEVVAELVSLSNEISVFMRGLDIKVAQAEKVAIDDAIGRGANASMMSLLIKQATAEYKADKEWGERQVSLLRDLRIAALSAQRSAEN